MHNAKALRPDLLLRVRLPIYLSRRALEKEFGGVSRPNINCVMTIAEAIPDAMTFAHSLGDICLIGAVIGCFFTLAACACVLEFSG